MQDYKNITAWQKAHSLAISIYQVTAKFPNHELYGLTSQIRNASVSIPANIAEGCGRNGDAEFSRFLHFSLGSANEVEYYLLLAHDLKLLNDSDFERLNKQIDEIRRMLIVLIKKLKSDEAKP